MKLRAERDNLLAALVTANRAGGRIGTINVPVAKLTVADGSLTVTSTDLSLTISARTSVNALDDGAAVVPGKLLAGVVKALPPGAIDIESDDAQLQVSSGRSRFTISVYAPSTFPILATPGGTPAHLSTAGLSEALRQVVCAASAEDSRPVLCGVLIEAQDGAMRLVATDSYRLAVRELPDVPWVLGGAEKVLVPGRALGELDRLLGNAGERITVRADDRLFSVYAGNVTLSASLIEGQYPPYQALMAVNNPSQLQVDGALLFDAVNRVSVMATEPTAPVRLHLEPDQVEVSMVGADRGSATEVVDASYDGKPMTVAFNPAYISDGIQAVGSGMVTIRIADPLKPVILTSPTSPGYTYLLMPVRVA